MYQVGLMYHYGQGVPANQAAARQWFEKAADENHADAQVALGRMYENSGLISRARLWYARAALQEHATGEVCMGILAYNERNYAQAVAWFRKAAARGDGRALYNLAVMTANGVGVAPDKARAYQLYQQAAAAGDELASRALLALR
jgi:hypothetical protein